MEAGGHIYMVRRSFDAGFMNRVVNHESVRDGAELTHDIDLTEVVANPDNYTLTNEHGGFIFALKSPGSYEVHTMFLPSGRGKTANDAAISALNYMFSETDCGEVTTQTNVNNKVAQRYARQFFTSRYLSGNYYHYSLTKDEWTQRMNTQEVTCQQ